MKRFLVLAFLLLAAVPSFSQAGNGFDVFVPIARYISKADVTSLSAWMDESVELDIEGRNAFCSRKQACSVLNSFFGGSAPSSFSIRHHVSDARTKSAIGVMEAGAKTYTVTIFVCFKTVENQQSYKIQYIRIDRI